MFVVHLTNHQPNIRTRSGSGISSITFADVISQKRISSVYLTKSLNMNIFITCYYICVYLEEVSQPVAMRTVLTTVIIIICIFAFSSPKWNLFSFCGRFAIIQLIICGLIACTAGCACCAGPDSKAPIASTVQHIVEVANKRSLSGLPGISLLQLSDLLTWDVVYN